MTNKHGKPGPDAKLASSLLEAFSISDDFDDRLAQVKPADRRGSQPAAPKMVFHQPFSEEKIDRLLKQAKSEEAQQYDKPIAPLVAKSPVGADPEQAQHQFYTKRLQEKLSTYPNDTPANSIKQSATLILYILQEFQYPIDEEQRLQIIHQMEGTLGVKPLPESDASAKKPKAPFRGQRLKNQVETLYKLHSLRYAALEMELIKLAAAEEERLREVAETEKRNKANDKRLEKKKRQAETSQSISEDRLNLLEQEFDAMLALSATNCGVDALQVMRFGYEEPVSEPEPAAPPSLQKKPQPALAAAPSTPLTQQEIIDRNNEGRRLRALREGK